MFPSDKDSHERNVVKIEMEMQQDIQVGGSILSVSDLLFSNILTFSKLCGGGLK